MQAKGSMSLKLVFVGFILVSICWALYSYYSPTPDQSTNTASISNPVANVSAKTNLPEAIHEAHEVVVAKKVSSDDNQLRTIAGTPAEAEVLRKWEEERGRFFKESMADYASYDIGTLQQMVEGGDVKAMIVLARKYVSPDHATEYGLKDQLPLLKLAAAHGSTHAMGLYATSLRAQSANFGADPATAHSYLWESLTWDNAAALRGDLTPNDNAKNAVKSASVNLTEKDIEFIKRRSRAIYYETLTQRRDLGLGDFNNDVPAEVKNYFSHLGNYLDEYPKN